MADEALHRRRPDDAEVEVVALRALGIARREEQDLDAALAHLERSVAAARAAGLGELEARSLVTLASVLLAQGELTAALRELDLARTRTADEQDLALIHMQRGTVLHRLGRAEAAGDGYDRAVAAARAAGDRLTEALALGNRGILAATGDRPADAEADLLGAESLLTELGMELAAADVRHNRGFAAASAGHLSVALGHYAAARAVHERLGVPRPAALLDEGRALLEANLVDDALRACVTAVVALRASGLGADLAEALLLLADARAAAGAEGAAEAAAEARARFAEQGREAWSALAALAELRAGAAVDAGAARRLAGELEALGWTDAAVEARLLAAARGGAARAEDLAAVATHRARGPAARRLRGWYALALLRLEAGDRQGAGRAATSGVRVAADHAVSLAATDLRARAGALVEPLVDIGLGLALEAGRPRRVLVWSERWRAGGLAPLLTPGADVGLGELRAVARRLRDEDLPAPARAELDRRRRRLEAEVDRRTRAAGATGPAGLVGDLDVAALAAELGPRTLVEHVLHDGTVHAVVVRGGRVRLHELAPVDEVGREVRALRMAAGRAARPGPAGERMAGAVAAAAARLDQLVLAPLGRHDELVLVPSGPLHAIPWPLLPGLAGRVATVAPSARLWLRAGDHPTGRRALVVSHGVAGGSAEAAAVAASYDDAVVLDGDAATSEAVLAHLPHVDVAHLAVHATFRGDNPLHSALHLADGPLFVHDLDRLPRTPGLVVLAACGAAQTSVDAGDELLGITASFLRSGTRTLVASTLPVADDLAPPLMAAFHAASRTRAPAAALRDAVAAAPAHAGAAFTCFGRG